MVVQQVQVMHGYGFSLWTKPLVSKRHFQACDKTVTSAKIPSGGVNDERRTCTKGVVNEHLTEQQLYASTCDCVCKVIWHHEARPLHQKIFVSRECVEHTRRSWGG